MGSQSPHGVDGAVRGIVVDENDLPVEALQCQPQFLHEQRNVRGFVESRNDDAEFRSPERQGGRERSRPVNRRGHTNGRGHVMRLSVLEALEGRHSKDVPLRAVHRLDRTKENLTAAIARTMLPQYRSLPPATLPPSRGFPYGFVLYGRRRAAGTVLWLRRIWRRGTKRGARTPERAELGRVASLSPGLELERDRLRSGGQASLGDGAEGEDYAEHEHDIEFDAGQFPPLSAPLVTQYSVGGLRNSTEKYTIL